MAWKNYKRIINREYKISRYIRNNVRTFSGTWQPSVYQLHNAMVDLHPDLEGKRWAHYEGFNCLSEEGFWQVEEHARQEIRSEIKRNLSHSQHTNRNTGLRYYKIFRARANRRYSKSMCYYASIEDEERFDGYSFRNARKSILYEYW